MIDPTSLSDMKRYGDLKIVENPRVSSRRIFRNYFKKTLKEEVKIKFKANVIASVEGEGGLIIDRLQKYTSTCAYDCYNKKE